MLSSPAAPDTLLSAAAATASIPAPLLARLEGHSHIRAVASFLDPGVELDEGVVVLLGDMLTATAERMQEWVNGVARARAVLQAEEEKLRAAQAGGSGVAREMPACALLSDYVAFVREVLPAVAAVMPATASSGAAPAAPVQPPPTKAQLRMQADAAAAMAAAASGAAAAQAAGATGRKRAAAAPPTPAAGAGAAAGEGAEGGAAAKKARASGAQPQRARAAAAGAGAGVGAAGASGSGR